MNDPQYYNICYYYLVQTHYFVSMSNYVVAAPSHSDLEQEEIHLKAGLLCEHTGVTCALSIKKTVRVRRRALCCAQVFLGYEPLHSPPLITEPNRGYLRSHL